MNIQTNYSSYGTQVSNYIAPQKTSEAKTQDLTETSGNRFLSDSSSTVTISKSAAELASRENTTTTRTPEQQKLIDSLKDNPAGAESIAYGMATIPSQVVYDISSGEIRLKSTGQLMENEDVRNAYVKNFQTQASKIDAQVKEIYYREKSNGTAAADIVAKIIDFKNTQSPTYLEATGLRI